MLHFNKTFFIVNSKEEIDLLNKNLILLFDTVENFKNKLSSTFAKINWRDNSTCTAITNNGILDFYFSDEEVIENYVIVDVKFTDEPFVEISNLCKKYGWLLFDLDTEKYIKINS